MESNVITITVDHEAITAVSAHPLVAGSIGVVNFTAIFDSSWEGYQIKLIFTAYPRGKKAVLKEVVGTSGEVPWEVLDAPGNLYISAVGVAEGKRQPTAVMRYSMDIGPSGTINGDQTLPSPEYLDQVLELVSKAKSSAEAAAVAAGNAEQIAQSVREDADNGKFDGPKGEPGAGVPEGGHAGEVLVKQSDDDWDTSWQSIAVPDEEFFAMLSGQGWVPAATSDGAILTDENGSIILW